MSYIIFIGFVFGIFGMGIAAIKFWEWYHRDPLPLDAPVELWTMVVGHYHFEMLDFDCANGARSFIGKATLAQVLASVKLSKIQLAEEYVLVAYFLVNNKKEGAKDGFWFGSKKEFEGKFALMPIVDKADLLNSTLGQIEAELVKLKESLTVR